MSVETTQAAAVQQNTQTASDEKPLVGEIAKRSFWEKITGKQADNRLVIKDAAEVNVTFFHRLYIVRAIGFSWIFIFFGGGLW